MATSPVSPDVARARFAVFVRRALDDARARGMTDREIAKKSGVATSTIHRWRRGEGGRELPELARVRAFCITVDASIEDAMRALGIGDDPAPQPTPEPPMPRDVKIIMRRLADPSWPEADKQFLRMSLQMLAARVPTEDRPPAEEAG